MMDDEVIDYPFEEDLAAARRIYARVERSSIPGSEQTDPTGNYRFRTFEELVAPYQDPEQLRQLIEEDVSDPELKAAFLADLGPIEAPVRRTSGPILATPTLQPMSFEESLAINGGEGGFFTKNRPPAVLKKIISSGQTGADRAALDWAIQREIEHGGYCPQGRVAEDGVIPSLYNLTETEETEYSLRTKRNVEESDATIIFTLDAAQHGVARETQHHVEHAGKRSIHLSRAAKYDVAASLRAFVRFYRVSVLNIVGSREKNEPGIYGFTRTVLDRAFPIKTDAHEYRR
ncbi:MAG: hypothetical protein QOH88_1759 [Verrucomicrobiota bacterium]|jgi:hypothetical protein